jgi:serine/threonine protein kinase
VSALTNGDSRSDLLTSSESSLSFGKYRLTRLIARGGMGEVYLARLVGELGFEKRLVIKTILPHLAAKPRFVELFAAEAKTAVALSHGNIVPIYELGRAGDTFYIVMGHVDGPSLSAMLDECRRRDLAPDVGAVLHIVRAVLNGLAYAHTPEPGRPAVVHRDITPRNVLVDRSGQVRIVDFGIAAPADAEVEVRGGSTGYASPEQIRGETVDPRADVFSAGCLLYEMLTLERAFPREGVWIAPDVTQLPIELRAPIRDAIALDPASRPADAGALLLRLAPAFAKYSATWSDPQLAAVLRQLFPDGWESQSEPAIAGSAVAGAPGRPQTQTFATRLTVITRSVPVQPAGTAPSAGRPWWPIAALALGAIFGAGWWFTRPDPVVARPPAAETPTLAASDPAPTRPATPDPLPRGSPTTSAPITPPPPTPPEPPTQALVVVPKDAVVTIDGSSVADLSRIAIPVTGATVIIRRAGYATRKLEVDATHPLPPRVELIANRPGGDGFLQVLAGGVEWAEVTVDGRKAGHTPTRKLSLPEGPHRVVVTCTDACPSKQILLQTTVTIRAGETRKLQAE